MASVHLKHHVCFGFPRNPEIIDTLKISKKNPTRLPVPVACKPIAYHRNTLAIVVAAELNTMFVLQLKCNTVSFRCNGIAGQENHPSIQNPSFYWTDDFAISQERGVLVIIINAS